MRIFFSILLNASILFIIWYLLNNESHHVVIVEPSGFDAWKTYFFGGIILGLLNTFIKPILKFLGLPLFFIYPIVSIGINAFILWMLSKLINSIGLYQMKFEIIGLINFIIAVAIFTILNIVYGILFSKK